MKKSKGFGKVMVVVLLAIVGIILLVGAFLMGKYNTLVKLNEQVNNSQAQIETYLQRRYDLIPNLVESVKGSMAQEEKVFTAIADARTKYGSAEAGSEAKIEAGMELESAISRLLVVIENYPELKSNENVRGLMDELAGTENRIATARKVYNDDATTYNTEIKSFPTSFIASLFNFEERSYFESVEDANVAPIVDFE